MRLEKAQFRVDDKGGIGDTMLPRMLIISGFALVPAASSMAQQQAAGAFLTIRMRNNDLLSYFYSLVIHLLNALWIVPLSLCPQLWAPITCLSAPFVSHCPFLSSGTNARRPRARGGSL